MGYGWGWGWGNDDKTVVMTTIIPKCYIVHDQQKCVGVSGNDRVNMSSNDHIRGGSEPLVRTQ